MVIDLGRQCSTTPNIDVMSHLVHESVRNLLLIGIKLVQPLDPMDSYPTVSSDENRGSAGFTALFHWARSLVYISLVLYKIKLMNAI